jgi:hypothetical protein
LRLSTIFLPKQGNPDCNFVQLSQKVSILTVCSEQGQI